MSARDDKDKGGKRPEPVRSDDPDEQLGGGRNKESFIYEEERAADSVLRERLGGDMETPA
jgi:hypothetical protein